jgi:hypothetical protein
MLVWKIFIEFSLPKKAERRIGYLLLLAKSLYLLFEILGKHSLEAVLDDIVRGIEGNTKAYLLLFFCLRLILFIKRSN